MFINNEILNELKKIKEENPKTTYKKLCEILKEKHNINISISTLSKKLKEDSKQSSKNNSLNNSNIKEETNLKEEEEEKINSEGEEEEKSFNNSDDSLNNSLSDDLKTERLDETNKKERSTLGFAEPINQIPEIKIERHAFGLAEPIPETKQNDERSNELEKSIIKNVYNPNNKFDEKETFEKRKTIIIIRQYIATFHDKLNYLYGKNKAQYEKNLYTYDLNKLKNILESIRCELALSKNKNITKQITETLLYSYEKGMKYTGINVDGISEMLLKDPDFMYDVQMLSCEVDLTSYLNPKTNILLKIAQQSYILYNKHKMEDKLNLLLSGVNLKEKTAQPGALHSTKTN